MFKKSVKMFETVMVWLLSLCLITQLLLVFKIMDLAYNLKGSITNQTDFITLVTKLSTKSVDLKAIQFLGATNRLFLLILLFVFAAFIVYRVIKKENKRIIDDKNIPKFNLANLISSDLSNISLIFRIIAPNVENRIINNNIIIISLKSIIF